MPANGDSALTQTWYTLYTVKRVVLDVLFDSGDGSFVATALAKKMDGYIIRMVTNPGAVAPTDDYDITLVDSAGSDVLQSLGLNRDTANTEDRTIVFSGTANHPVVEPSDTLTLTIINNIVHSATTQITLWFSALGN